MCASLFRNVHNKLPCETSSHLNSKDTKCSWSHPGWNWRSWATRDAEGTDAQDVTRINEGREI